MELHFTETNVNENILKTILQLKSTIYMICSDIKLWILRNGKVLIRVRAPKCYLFLSIEKCSYKCSSKKKIEID